MYWLFVFWLTHCNYTNQISKNQKTHIDCMLLLKHLITLIFIDSVFVTNILLIFLVRRQQNAVKILLLISNKIYYHLLRLKSCMGRTCPRDVFINKSYALYFPNPMLILIWSDFCSYPGWNIERTFLQTRQIEVMRLCVCLKFAYFLLMSRCVKMFLEQWITALLVWS